MLAPGRPARACGRSSCSTGSSAQAARQRGLGQQLGLQRQQVAEDAGQRDHHVDARAAELVERDQRRRRRGGRSCRSAARRPSAPAPARSGRPRSSGCRCPTARARSTPGSAVAVGRRAASSSRSAWRAPSRTAKALGMRNGSKPCRLRPVGRIAGVRSRSPPGAGRTIAAVERAQDAGDLVSCAQQPVGVGEFAQRSELRPACRAGRARLRRRACDERLDRGALRHGAEVDSAIASSRSARSAATARADDVQAVRDQRVFELEHRVGERCDLRLGVVAPGRLGGGEVELRRPAPGSARRASARSRVGLAARARASARARP